LAGTLSVVQSVPLDRGALSTVAVLSADEVVGAFERVPGQGQDLGFGAFFRGIRYTPTSVEVDILQPLWGDYNASGHISQADLDLVLLNWGRMPADVPADWVADRPVSRVGQVHLDRVLLRWGESVTSTSRIRGVGVPEPTSLSLMMGVLALLIFIGRNTKIGFSNANWIEGHY
jgi:hypothetical protein